MQDEINALKYKVKQQENVNVASELRLNEIPYKPNENLLNIFDQICNTINTTVPAIKTIYRLQNHNNKQKTDSRDAVIIVKFWSPYDKNYFLKTLSNWRKNNPRFFFTLRDIGENSDNKFYVNENLTSTNFKILRAATRLKKEHRIYSAFTIRGLVYVKISANDQAIHIDELEHLNNLFRAPDVSLAAGEYPNVSDNNYS